MTVDAIMQKYAIDRIDILKIDIEGAEYEVFDDPSRWISKVGAIRTAQQGLFSIEDRDQFSPELKKVRVVTTVDYYLSD